MNSKLHIALAACVIALSVPGCASWHQDKSANAGSSATPRGPVTTTSDAAITAKVKAKFAADETVRASSIDVDTVRGIVTLHGKVRSAAERDRAVSLARGTEGVVDVKSDLNMGS